MLSAQLFSNWYNAQAKISTDHVAVVRSLDAARSAIDRNQLGFGIPRAIYELDRSAPCLSPLVKDRFVLSTKGVLQALDTIADQPNRPTEPMDAHLAAFLAAREKRLEDWMVKELSAPEDHKRRLAVLRTLAIGSAADDISVSKLTKWCAEMVQPIVDEIHHVQVKETLNREIGIAIKDGDLRGLLAAVSNIRIMRADRDGFREARQEHKALQREIDRLERELTKPSGALNQYGQYYAVVVAGAMSLLGVSAVAVFMGMF